MSVSAQSPARSHLLLWAMLLLAAVALVIDLVDGYTPKTMTSLGLLIGLAGFLLVRLSNRTVFNWLAIGGLVLCIGSAVYRAAVYQGWVQG